MTHHDLRGPIALALVLSLVLSMPTVAQDDASSIERPIGETGPAVTNTKSGQGVNVAESANATAQQERPPLEEARRTYMGRIVAMPMSHLGASWLTRPERDEEENASQSLEQLRLTPGMTVVDMGCGNGYWTLPMAKRVAPTGRVLGVDIQPEMLDKLKLRASKRDIDNVVPVLGDVDNPNLPIAEVDLVLMVDVYHEFSHPESMLWSIRRSLKPDGVVALLEYRAEDPAVPIKPLHKMSKKQIIKEYEANGFRLVRQYDELPWQHLMFFGRDDAASN